MKPLVLRSAIVAALGGLIFGFDTAVISGAVDQIQSVFGLSDAKLGFTVTTALIGTIVGALTAGRPADRYGRKKILYAIGVLYVIGALGSALAPNVETLMLFRFLGGLGVGAASVCAPIYTAEVAPAAHRGRLVGLVQFNIVLGILVAYASNAIVRALAENAGELEGIGRGELPENVLTVGIGQIIDKMSEIATTVASAVEEQGAATQEIARNVQQASAGTAEVSSNIVGITEAARDTGKAAERVKDMSGQINTQVEVLQTEVAAFLKSING